MGTRAPLTAAVALATGLLAGCATRGGTGVLGVRADAVESPRTVPTASGLLTVYEVEVRNESDVPARLESLVRRRSDVPWPEAVEGPDLARRVVPRRRVTGLLDQLDLPAGGRSVILLEATHAAGAAPSFEHDLGISATGDHGRNVRETVTATEAAADPAPPVVLGPPLAGDRWLFENGPATLSGHRRAVVWLGRRPRAVQRFSADFFRVDGEGRTASPEAQGNEAHHAFGAEVLAAADASVAVAVDGIPDNEPDPRERAVEMSRETVAGNHVVLDLGGGRFLMYAHLRAGSVRVRAGDRVRRGDVIGALGNSGNSTEPHLHLHVADSASPVDATGLPFVFDGFASGGAQFAGVLPAEGSVVAFPDRAASIATTGVPSESTTR